VWLSGMTAGLMAGACRNDRYEGEESFASAIFHLPLGAGYGYSQLNELKDL
jgi:hypothetical protein